MPPSAAQSPSPTLPLLILLLVLFMAVGPWFMTTEPALEEAMIRARRSNGRAMFPAEALILIPAIILILFQFYGSYENSILTHWRLPQFKLSDSFVALVGFLAVAIALSWMRSSVKEMVYSL